MTLTKKVIIFSSIGLILIVGCFLFSRKTEAAAVVYNPTEFVKQYIIQPLVRKIANSLENKLVNASNKKINSGSDTHFITNWRNYVLESMGRGNDVFRSTLSGTELCPYLKNSILTSFGADKFVATLNSANTAGSGGQVNYRNLISAPGTASFQTLARCSLPSGFDVSAFQQDFRNGGWAAWAKLIEPQNNALGVYALSLQEQSNQMAIEQKSASDSSLAGGGYLSQKLGLSGKASSSGCVDVGGTLGGGDQGPTMTTRCTFLGKTVTPGKLFGDANTAALNTKLGRVGGATEITDIILTLLDAVVTGVVGRLENSLGQTGYGMIASQLVGTMFNETSKEPSPGDPGAAESANAKNQGQQTQNNAYQLCYDNCVTEQTKVCDAINGNTEPERKQECQNNIRNTCDSKCKQ